MAEQAQDKAAKLQAQVAARQQAATAQTAAKQAAIEQKTAAKPTGTGPGSQQQTGAAPDPILATSNPSAGGILLSAQTAVLERTPHPNGRPGGPGLYGKAGNKHSDYFEQIVHALMTKRGMDQATASRIAWGALRKWRAGGGQVHPEVRAAAAGAGQDKRPPSCWAAAWASSWAGGTPGKPSSAAGEACGRASPGTCCSRGQESRQRRGVPRHRGHHGRHQ